MLVLTRKPDQSIMIGSEIEITVLEVRGEQVRLGIRAPRNVTVHRKEVFEQIKQENQSASETPVEVIANLNELLNTVSQSKEPEEVKR